MLYCGMSVPPRALLGLPRGASLAQIHKAYRQLAALHRPGESDDDMIALNTAFCLLVFGLGMDDAPPETDEGRPRKRIRVV